MQRNDWATIRPKLYKIFSFFTEALKVANFINFVTFLFQKKNIGRNLSERILGISLIKQDPNLERNLNFTLINRLIVWTALG